MPRASIMQTGFAFGELSPRLAARVETDEYHQGLATLKNAVVLPQGGVMRRSGTRFVAETKTSATASRLVPFEFSVDDAYILEFGNLYIRVYKNGAQVYSTGITPVEITTTYTTAEIPDLRFCQSLDTLYILHPDHPPATLGRYSDTEWVLADIQFKDGPFLPMNTGGTTLTPSATTGSITLTASTPIVNGTFDSDISGWSWQGSITPPYSGYSWDSGTQSMKVYNILGDYVIVYQAVSVTEGRSYTVSYDATIASGSYFYFRVGTNARDASLCNATISSGGSHSHTFTIPKGVSTVYILFWTRTSASTFYIDNVEFYANIFDSGHVGSLWKLTHPSKIQEVTKSFTAAAQNSDSLMMLSDGIFTVTTTGTWVGTLTLQESFDSGSTWSDKATYISNQAKTITSDGAYYRLYSTAWTSGTAVTTLSQVLHEQSGIVEITAITNVYTATATVIEDLYSTDATADWYEGSWSGYRGYPSLATFYENRLMLASTEHQPATVWGSNTDDYYNFGTTLDLADSEAVEFTLLSRKMNAIKWMEGAGKLKIGTAGSEWWMAGASDSEALTPSSVRAREEGHNGSLGLDTARIGENILFVQRSGKMLMEMAYNHEYDYYTTSDISIVAEHMPRQSPITSMAFAQYPNSILWCVREDGVLIGVTYQISRKVLAWHRHVTEGSFESVAVIPGDGRDEVWVIVNRTIGGATKRYVEYLEADFDSDVDCEDAFFVDSGLSYTGFNTDASKTMTLSGASYGDGNSVTLTATGHTPFTTPGSIGDYYRLRSGTDIVDVLITAYTSTSVVTATLLGDAPASLQATATDDWAEMFQTLSGLDHLEGETVQVLADGGVHADCTVASGSITLDAPAAVVHAGLGFTTDIKTMRIEGGSADGTSQGRQKKIDEVVLRFYQTRGAQIGRDESHLDDISFDDLTDDTSGIPLPVFSGDYNFDYDGGIDSDAQIMIRQDQPLPLCLLGLVAHLEAYER